VVSLGSVGHGTAGKATLRDVRLLAVALGWASHGGHDVARPGSARLRILTAGLATLGEVTRVAARSRWQCKVSEARRGNAG
jgi:hypothetical protein